MSWWDYMGDEYSYEKIQQHATNVILNPKLNALRIIFFYLFIFTLQYCIGFAIHQHESATGVQLPLNQ